MDYKILETVIKFEPDGTIKSVLALVSISDGDIRAIYADRKYRSGYMAITNRTDCILYDLLQEVAGFGMAITDTDIIPSEWLDKYFKS